MGLGVQSWALKRLRVCGFFGGSAGQGLKGVVQGLKALMGLTFKVECVCVCVLFFRCFFFP